MKPLTHVLKFVCVLVLSGVASCQSLPDNQITNAIEAYLKPFVETGNFSGAVLVARHGVVLFRRSYGMANYELQVPNSPETRFHIASITKPFTAAAILQLQEQGRLSIADPVSRFAPDFPNGDKITLDNLLTHTSGIPDINDIDDYDTFARSPHAIPDLIAKFANLPLQFQPGSKYEYSNSNYNLLALVIERVSGESYGDYLRKHIFDPVGMKNSGHDGDATQLIPSVASGYRPAGIRSFEKAPYLDWSNKTGNGSLYSTIDDLYRFDRALNTDTVLKAPTRQKYFVKGEGNRYGWYFRERFGHRAMSGLGRSLGFTTELDRFPDDDVTIVLFGNSYSTATQDPIGKGIAAIVFGQQPAPVAFQPVAIPQAALAACAGLYQYGPEYFTPNAKFTLTAEDGYLLLTVEDSRRPLVPLSENDFLERYFFGHIVMTRDAAGNITGLITRYGEKDYVAHRLTNK